MNLIYAYMFLALAIALEITGTSFVKDTEGFTRWVPSIICLVTICFSYYLMSHVVGFIPVGITYATWSGLGIVAITIIGVFKYNQIPNIPTIIGLVLIIVIEWATWLQYLNLMINLKEISSFSSG